MDEDHEIAKQKLRKAYLRLTAQLKQQGGQVVQKEVKEQTKKTRPEKEPVVEQLQLF